MDAEPYVGEIRMFAGNYAPDGWALCNGQTLPVNGNELLYSLINDTYGGTATSFNLPDLRGRVAVHQQPGNPGYILGNKGGSENTALTVAQLPPHTHTLSAQSTAGTTNVPTNAVFANTGTGDSEYTNETGNVKLGAASLSSEGQNQSFNNIQPSLPISFIIALTGIYPTPQ